MEVVLAAEKLESKEIAAQTLLIKELAGEKPKAEVFAALQLENKENADVELLQEVLAAEKAKSEEIAADTLMIEELAAEKPEAEEFAAEESKNKEIGEEKLIFGFTAVKRKNKRHKKKAAAVELKAKEIAEVKLKEASEFTAEMIQLLDAISVSHNTLGLAKMLKAGEQVGSLRCGDTAGKAAIRQRWGCTVLG